MLDQLALEQVFVPLSCQLPLQCSTLISSLYATARNVGIHCISLILCILRSQVQIWSPEPPQPNAVIASHIRQCSFPSIFFPVHYSLTELQTTSLNKPHIRPWQTKRTHPEARTAQYSRKQFLAAWCCHAVEQATGATRNMTTAPVVFFFHFISWFCA